jgi:hypothetical protein
MATNPFCLCEMAINVPAKSQHFRAFQGKQRESLPGAVEFSPISAQRSEETDIPLRHLKATGNEGICGGSNVRLHSK